MTLERENELLKEQIELLKQLAELKALKPAPSPVPYIPSPYPIYRDPAHWVRPYWVNPVIYMGSPAITTSDKTVSYSSELGF